MDDVAFHPIGLFHCAERYSYDAARQGALADNRGEVRLATGHRYEEALRDLAGFSHIWLVFVLHQNSDWKPLVQPPRGLRRVGVFACRSPHRPNPIGLSLVELEGIDGLTVRVRGHDLLDGTPVLDIKPYIPYADAAEPVRTGWLEEVAATEEMWQVAFEDAARDRIAWLEARGVDCLRAFVSRELARQPTDGRRKRVRSDGAGGWTLAYRTWRIGFSADEASRTVQVRDVCSGYTEAELAPDASDRYADLDLHRAFRAELFWFTTRSRRTERNSVSGSD